MAKVELRILTWLAWGLNEQRKYTTFSIARRNGSVRQISAPIKPLKEFQQALAESLLEGYRAPAHVHGFTTGRGPRTNAEVHVDKFHVFRADLADFFPSITYRRVRGLFRRWPFEHPDDLAKVLARLCCHQDALPQGAPTSPIISNFICRRMDRELAQLAAAERCHFSRYADDLVFSTNQHLFPPAIGLVEEGTAVAGDRLKGIVTTNGFSINADKTTLTRETQRQRVTGIVVNEKINPPREYVRSLRSLLYIWKTYGQPAAEAALAKHDPPSGNRPPGKSLPRFEQVVRGRVQYVGSLKEFRNPTYYRLAKQLSEVDEGFSPPPMPIIEANLYTEGPSDWRHVLAAQRHFNELGEFTDFHLVKGKEASREGESQLRKFAERLGEREQSEFSVCLFDSDVKPALEAVGPDGWRRYGPRVVAVGLAVPAAMDRREPLFIEKLYSEEVLKTKLANGRRVYLGTEFNPKSGHHLEEDCSIVGEGKEFIQQSVHAFDTHSVISLTKVDFSKAVYDDPEHFGTEIFEGFRPTFERIDEALRDSWEVLQ
ncbi:MAG: RNA-directed DNA polymerase [Actinobacteria bacterium]|nr:RNA-directed DNA polymerase [Actinomycetota bacterium]